jgi:hypothetical protein
LKAAVLAGLCCAVSLATSAHDFDLSVDLRAISSHGQTSYLNGGLGKLRFDEAHDGLRLGSLRLGYRGDITDSLHLTAEAFAYGDHDVNPLDLTELQLSWRPVPASLWRTELKLGAFYPAISLENRMRGWRSPYSISFSAINSWIGEELRTIGAEYNLDWLGQQSGSNFDLGFSAAVFGWNDPAGVVMGMRGWSLHDRQSTLFGRVGRQGQGVVDGRKLFYDDIDGRAGFHFGASARFRGLLEARLMHYDNRGDPAAEAPAIDDYAWRTRFDAFGLRYTPDERWTAIWQYLRGSTAAGEPVPPNDWRYDAQFLLLSWRHGSHRLTARYDDFSMRQLVSYFGAPNHDRGHAQTYAWLYDVNAQWSLALEALQIDSNLRWRSWLGAPQIAHERQLQLALRYEM